MKESKLKQYAATLLDMKDAGQTFDQLQAWLKSEGLTVGRSTVSDYVQQLISKREQEGLISQIVSGAQQVQQVEKEFAKNPAPELETIIKLHRVLILQLSTAGRANPALLQLSDQLTNTVLQAISAQSKAHFKEREVTLAEQKAADAKKSDQQKALEMCLDEAKQFPEVLELFRTAFAALAKAKTK